VVSNYHTFLVVSEMKYLKYLILVLPVLFLVSYAYGQDIFGNEHGLLPPMQRDAYGSGIHSDGTGRPFKFKTFDGQDVGIFDVESNAYGPGISMDEFGRPVRPVPEFGY